MPEKNINVLNQGENEILVLNHSNQLNLRGRSIFLHRLEDNQCDKMKEWNVNHRIIMRIIHVNHVYIKPRFHNWEKLHLITKTNGDQTCRSFSLSVILTQIIKLKNKRKYFAQKQQGIMFVANQIWRRRQENWLWSMDTNVKCWKRTASVSESFFSLSLSFSYSQCN